MALVGGNTVDLILKATDRASPAIKDVAGQLGGLDLAGRKAAGGGLADMGKAIPTLAGTLFSLASAIPGPIGLISQLGAATVGHLSKMSAEADATLQHMTALADGIQATFEETQAAVQRIRAEAAGNVGKAIELQYTQELAAIDKAYAKQVAAAKGNALQIQAIEADAAGKRLIAHAQYEAELSKLSQKRLELAKQLGIQVRDAETAITQALLEEQGKRTQALDVGAQRQAEILKAGYQKQLEEIKKLGGTETEQYQLRRAAQEAYEAQSLQQTTETEIKRRAIVKQQAEFLADLAKGAGAAEASLAVAVAESQGKQVAAIQIAGAQRKALLDAEYQETLKRIALQGLTEQQALAARLTAERTYHAQSAQLALEMGERKKQIAAEAAAKEAEAVAKFDADRKARQEKDFQEWLHRLEEQAKAYKALKDSAADVAAAEAEATAAVLEGQGKQLEAIQTTAAQRQQIIEDTYVKEIEAIRRMPLTAQENLTLKLNAEKKYAADSIALTTQTESQRKRLVEDAVQGSLAAFSKLGAGWEGIQQKLTMANFITETQKGITALQQLGAAVTAGDQTLKLAGITLRDVEMAQAGLTRSLVTAVQTGVIPGTQAVQQNTAANQENIKTLSDGTKILSEQAASWANVGNEIGKATGQLTAWAQAEKDAKKGGGGGGGAINFSVPSWVKTAADVERYIKGGTGPGGASVTPPPASNKGKISGATGHNQTNNINVNVGSVNDKQRVQELTATIMQAIADAERRRS